MVYFGKLYVFNLFYCKQITEMACIINAYKMLSLVILHSYLVLKKKVKFKEMFLISRLTYHCKTSLTGTLNIFSELFFINVPDLDGQELYRERLCESHKRATACRYFDKKGIEDLRSAINPYPANMENRLSS